MESSEEQREVAKTFSLLLSFKDANTEATESAPWQQ